MKYTGTARETSKQENWRGVPPRNWWATVRFGPVARAPPLCPSPMFLDLEVSPAPAARGFVFAFLFVSCSLALERLALWFLQLVYVQPRARALAAVWRLQWSDALLRFGQR